MNGNLSTNQFSSITESKQAMPETTRFDGPGGLEPKSGDNFSQNKSISIPKPGFSG
jgi:hypothetical protein